MIRFRAGFLTALALLALAPAAHAFSGRNGAIVYGWNAWYGEWSSIVQGGIWMASSTDRFERSKPVYGCDVEAPDTSAADSCTKVSYADPSIATDGRRVVFDAGPSLAVVSIDGSAFRALPAHSTDDGQPAWSPSGTRIAFVETPARRPSVWICDAQGGHARRLANGNQPAWSARNWIAFVRGRRIYRIRPDGSGLRRLTGVGYQSPAWSPHGMRLAYLRSRGGSGFLMDADGRHAHQLPRAGGSTRVVWSPDGTELLFDDVFNSLQAYDLRTHRSRDTGAGGNATGATYEEHTYGFDWQPLR
jgi:Tol biopolymer transport system component